MTEINRKVSNKLKEKRLLLVSAESCTGGWVAKRLTDLAGSSAIFDRGFVTYSNQAKQDMLGVLAKTLETHGAVSEEVVAEMVAGALKNSQADIALSISGIAGPEGGTVDKPVGIVCFGWMKRDETAQVATKIFAGDRDEIRRQAVDFSLEGITKLIK